MIARQRAAPPPGRASPDRPTALRVLGFGLVLAALLLLGGSVSWVWTLEAFLDSAHCRPSESSVLCSTVGPWITTGLLWAGLAGGGAIAARGAVLHHRHSGAYAHWLGLLLSLVLGCLAYLVALVGALAVLL